MRPDDYLAIVDALMSAHNGRPGQAELRKAISIAYYAVFYALCQNIADCFVGTLGDGRSEWAWRQAYRAVDHGFARRQCQNQQVMARFSPEIQSFANNFVWLQEQRHVADYDPGISIDLDHTQSCRNEAVLALAALAEASPKDRYEFAVWATLRHRP